VDDCYEGYITSKGLFVTGVSVQFLGELATLYI